jgi:hypothetical protein
MLSFFCISEMQLKRILKLLNLMIWNYRKFALILGKYSVLKKIEKVFIDEKLKLFWKIVKLF